MSRSSFERDDYRVWLNEFESFLKQTEVLPPESVNETVLSFVHAQLNPPLQRWGTKLLGIHVVTALLFMTICPQLGVGPFVGDFGLGHIFMRFGHLPCTALCGAIFLALSATTSSLILNREELRVANRHRILNVSFLTAISFVGLMLAGGESDRLNYLVWLLGAGVAGWSTFKLGAWLRLREGVRPNLAGF